MFFYSECTSYLITFPLLLVLLLLNRNNSVISDQLEADPNSASHQEMSADKLNNSADQPLIPCAPLSTVLVDETAETTPADGTPVRGGRGGIRLDRLVSRTLPYISPNVRAFDNVGCSDT
jgi:hypothetical protein